MKKCKHCKTEIEKDAKVCPQCRKKQGMPKWGIVLIVIGVLLVISSFGSLSEDGKGNTKNNGKTNTSVEASEKLVLLDGHKGYQDTYAYYIEGQIKNNTDKEYDYVQVTFTLYDAAGNTIGTAVDNNSGLDANGTWSFKAMGLETNDSAVASYKLKEVTGY